MKNCIAFKVNKLLVDTLQVEGDLLVQMTHCQKVCLKDPEIYEQIEELLFPEELNIKQAIIETKKDIEQTASLIGNIYVNHKSMIKVCEAYQTNSLYHQTLRNNLVSEI